MIVAAVVCPHPPLLFRELTGQQDVAAELRAACLSALSTAIGAGVDSVVVVGGSDRTGSWDPALQPEVRRFGTTGPVEASGLPLSLGVGRRLLDEVGWTGQVEMHGIAWRATAEEIAELAGSIAGRNERLVLLVLGDGSTRRGDKAPGYLDERAFGFDEETCRALAEGDAVALRDVDPVLAEELMVLGRAAFGVLGSVALLEGASPRASVLYRADPFGVMYVVALWQND